MNGLLINFLLLLIFPFFAPDQPSLKIASSQEDRIGELLANADATLGKDWAKSVEYAQQALREAVAVENDSLIFRSMLVLSKGYEGLGNYEQAKAHAKEALNRAASDSQKEEVLHFLGIIHQSLSEFEASLKYYLEALELQRHLGTEPEVVLIQHSVAYVYEAMSQYDKALELLQKNQTYYEGLGDSVNISRTIFSIGMSPAELVTEIKLQHARELLTAGRVHKLAEIASIMGFDSPSYFSRVYFDRFGKKPTDYFI